MKALLHHLDKLVIAALVALVVWRVYANFRDMSRRSAQYAADLTAARRIADKSRTSALEIPPKDSKLQSEAVLQTWFTLPPVDAFEWYMFYPAR